MDNNPVHIYTEKEKELLFGKYGTKHLKVIVHCEQCGQEYIVQLHRLKTGQLCRKCKIANTKKNASPEQKRNIQEKSLKTCLEKYGVDNVFKNKQVKEKIKNSLQEKYGVSNPRALQLNENYIPLKEKKKLNKPELKNLTESQLEDHFKTLQSLSITKWNDWTEEKVKDISSKRKKTCLRKFGVEYTAQVPFVRVKSSFTRRNKSPEEKKAIRSKSCKKYTYEDQCFDSSWELAVWIWALDMHKNIIREPTVFEYFVDGEKYTYFPDFEIDSQLVEIKGPQYFDNTGKMINPYNHALDDRAEAKHQCGLRNNVQFWGKKEIKHILSYIKETYGPQYLNQFKK